MNHTAVAADPHQGAVGRVQLVRRPWGVGPHPGRGSRCGDRQRPAVRRRASSARARPGDAPGPGHGPPGTELHRKEHHPRQQPEPASHFGREALPGLRHSVCRAGGSTTRLRATCPPTPCTAPVSYRNRTNDRRLTVSTACSPPPCPPLRPRRRTGTRHASDRPGVRADVAGGRTVTDPARARRPPRGMAMETATRALCAVVHGISPDRSAVGLRHRAASARRPMSPSSGTRGPPSGRRERA